MLLTYKAVLRGNQLEWRGEQPANLNDEREVEALVTILREDKTRSNDERGNKMREALEKLAAANSLQEISDAVEWQRKQREDRSLPGRDA